MSITKYQIFLGLITLFAVFYDTRGQMPSNIAQDANLQQLSLGSEAFAIDLFKRIAIAVEKEDYDFMISPFSIWTLMVLTAEGATDRTLSELQGSLRLWQDFSSIRESFTKIQKALNINTNTVEVTSFQAIFPDLNKPTNRTYQSILRKYYETDVVQVNYRQTLEAQSHINGYVAKATKGMIDYLVNERDLLDAHLVLISTIFFKGQWKFPFNRTLTKEEPFYSENNQPVATVNMMNVKGPFPYASIAQIESHVLELPYGKEDRLVMIVFLPRKGVPLTKVIENIAKVGIPSISEELRKSAVEFEDDEVEVYLPRFTTISDFQMNAVLEQMGILDAFDPNKAKFPYISEYPLYISNVFHKTRIEVTEEGTVASAGTAGTFANKATPPRFYVNRPFAYVILEKTSNSLLFCGQVRKPKLF